MRNKEIRLLEYRADYAVIEMVTTHHPQCYPMYCRSPPRDATGWLSHAGVLTHDIKYATRNPVVTEQGYSELDDLFTACIKTRSLDVNNGSVSDCLG